MSKLFGGGKPQVTPLPLPTPMAVPPGPEEEANARKSLMQTRGRAGRMSTLLSSGAGGDTQAYNGTLLGGGSSSRIA